MWDVLLKQQVLPVPEPKIVASIEARMGSSRLPGKVLKDIAGQPALTRLLRRLRQCKKLDSIILATTTLAADDALVDWANKEKLPYFRGSEEDVLNRVVKAQQQTGSDIVVEICGDCVLIDPEIVDMAIETFLENDCDVVSTCRQKGYPMGMAVQVFRLSALEKVEKEIMDPPVREHVSLYFYEHPELYKIIHLLPPQRWYAPHYRWQLDYPEDLEFIDNVYKSLEPKYGGTFGIEEIMSLLNEKPELVKINQHCVENIPRQKQAVCN